MVKKKDEPKIKNVTEDVENILAQATIEVKTEYENKLKCIKRRHRQHICIATCVGFITGIVLGMIIKS